MNECVTRNCPPMPYGASQISHCTVCHETFRSDHVGDRHRVGTFDPPARRCLTPAEMLEKGWDQDPKGRWGRASRDTRWDQNTPPDVHVNP